PIDLDSIKKYDKKTDHHSLTHALKTAISHTTEKHAGESIYAPSNEKPPHKSLLYRLIPSMRGWEVKRHYGNYVIVRETGEKIWEEMPLYARIGMHLLFSGKVEEKVVESHPIRHLFEVESKRQGQYYDSPHSIKSIPSFIKHYNIKTDELLEPDISKYRCFNEFFYRKLKPDARPPASPDDDNVVVSAADCRLNALEFDGGSIAIFRLAPQDYHRFHSPITCMVGSAKHINGAYFTVNPMAINENLDVFTENVRSTILLHPKDPDASKVAFVAVGALLVGSIKFTVKEGNRISKGDELGYFAYGGSTIICLWRKGEIKFDEDLVSNSKSTLETLVKAGMRIGAKPSAPVSE
ncbi:30727_t:CDS:2, partial [Gigaspora margarita]